jgi:hypothetical protein
MTDAGRAIADNHRRHRRRRSGTAGVERGRARARGREGLTERILCVAIADRRTHRPHRARG